MALRAIKDFPKATPSTEDLILIEQQGGGRNVSLKELPVSTPVEKKISDVQKDLNARITALAFEPGDTTGDAELRDIRNPADGFTVPAETNAGGAVRAQVTQLDEKISNLKGDIGELKNSQTYSINKPISELETDHGVYYSAYDGTRIELNLTNSVKVDNLHKGDVITVYTNNTQVLACFNKDGIFVKGSIKHDQSFETVVFEIDDNSIEYAWINISINTQNQFSISLETILNAQQVIYSFETILNAQKVFYSDETKFDAVASKQSLTVPNIGWIKVDGTIATSSSVGQWQYSDKISSYIGQRIDYYCYGQQGVATVIFFDTNDNVLSYVTYEPTESEITGIVQGTVYAPDKVSYFRICTFILYLKDWHAEAYDGVNLPDTLRLLANKTSSSQSSPWKGKTINCLGDSITYGAGLTSNVTERWTTLLAEATGATVNNYGVSGSKVSDIDGDSIASFIDRYQSMSDSDLVIIFGGTNDYWHGVTDIGTMGSTDVSTFCGALSTIFANLLAKDPITQVVYVFPYQQYFNGSNSRTDKGHGTLKDFRNASKEICEYYSVPMLDLYSTSGFDVIDSTVQRDALMSDGLHPNADGHKYLAKRIQKFIDDINAFI